MQNTIKTRLYKNFYNDWVAETTMLLSANLELTIKTSKRASKNLTTTACVSKLAEDGMSSTHALYQDFSTNICTSKPSRITAKLVEAQHNNINLTDIVDQAKTFYKLS